MVKYKRDSQIHVLEDHNDRIMQEGSKKKGHVSQPTYLDYTNEPRQQIVT